MPFSEIIGYAASLAVLISFLTTSVIKLRIINMVGCLLFVLYGLLIKAYPIAGVNLIIVGIQIYFLYKMLNTKSEYRIVKCSPKDMFLQDFIMQHIMDIREFLPGFVQTLPDKSQCYICMVNEELAGVWVVEKKDTTFNILLEYVKDKFRDCGMGRYIYHDKKEFFRKEGIAAFEASKIYGKHAEYLQKIGFKKSEKEEGKYVLNI